MKKKYKRRLLYKPDIVFREDLIKGRFGQHVIQDILRMDYGHHLIPLEEWSDSIEIVKDAALKRRRKTDLVCKKCKMRIEVRAKTRDIIAMSDSAQRPFEKDHADEDWVAFPILKVQIVEIKEVNFQLQFTKMFQLQKVYFVQIKELKRTKKLAKRKKSGRGESFLVWKEGDRYNVLDEDKILTMKVINNKVEPHLPLLECRFKE